MKIIVLCLALAGCATPPASLFAGICALQPIGQQDGVAYMRYTCEPDAK